MAWLTGWAFWAGTVCPCSTAVLLSTVAHAQLALVLSSAVPGTQHNLQEELMTILQRMLLTSVRVGISQPAEHTSPLTPATRWTPATSPARPQGIKPLTSLQCSIDTPYKHASSHTTIGSEACCCRNCSCCCKGAAVTKGDRICCSPGCVVG